MLRGDLHCLNGQHVSVTARRTRLGVATLATMLGLVATEWWYRSHEFEHWVYVPDLLYARPAGWTEPGWVEGGVLSANAPSDVRVLCVGDSVTEGLGVRADEAWPNQLREHLGLRTEELLNFGVTGWDADQVATLIETRLGPWGPDVVVWGTYANDIFPTQLVYDTGDGAPRWVASAPPAGAAVLPDVAARWLIPRSAIYRVFLAARFARSEEAHRLASGGAEWYRTQVSRIASWSTRTRVPVVVLAIPPHVLTGPCSRGVCRTLRGWYDTVTSVLADQSALPWVDGLAALDRTGPFYRGGSEDMDHPNAEGHRRLAVAVEAEVERTLSARATAEVTGERALVGIGGPGDSGGGR